MGRKRNFHLLLLLSCLIFTILTQLWFLTQWSQIYHRITATSSEFLIKDSLKIMTAKRAKAVMGESHQMKGEVGKVKRILVYTTVYKKVFRAKGYWEELQKERPSGLHCEWSTDKSLYNKSDAVVFHLYNNLNRKDFVLRHLPPRHNNEQLWALMIQEPQAFYYPHQLKLLNDLFNLTITFQSDSDIVIPYGRYERRNLSEMERGAEVMEAVGGNERNKTLLWVVSNCNTSSRREDYVDHLKAYIDIDIYGKCVPKPNGHKLLGREREQLAKRYKFYLAFENADCDDYVTEKFWESLMLGMIPVVRGSRVRYDKLAPPNSYIHADAFLTPKYLAQHLLETASNQSLFSRYHKWRASYSVLFRPNRRNWMNELCRKVHQMKRRTVDVYRHFSYDTRCFTYLNNEDRHRSVEHMEDINRA